MHVKNIRNMKFNGQIFKIHTKKEIYEKFEKFLSKLVWRKTLFFYSNVLSLNLFCRLRMSLAYLTLFQY